MNHLEAHKSPGKHPRTFKVGVHDNYIAANYHLQEWGAPSHSDHDLHGTYETPTGDTITVSHVQVGPTGHPEFLLEWNARGNEHGPKITVIDEDTAMWYLVNSGAISAGE